MRFVLVVVVFTFVGCANVVYPLSTGSHSEAAMATKDKKYRVVVWATHPAVSSTITSLLQQSGHTVVERAKLQQIFDEQKLRLTNTSEDDALVLRVGKLLGADRVIFGEHSLSSNVRSDAYITPYGGASQSQTIFHLGVAVRSVDVETGEIRWAGAARYPQPIASVEEGLPKLTTIAIAHAWCRIESGYEWIEFSASGGGCRKKE